MVIEPELTADAGVDVPNLYERDNATGALTAITTKDNQPEIAPLPPGFHYCLSYGGASGDSGRAFFAANGKLIEGGSEEAANGFNLYEWAAARPPAQRLALVSVLPSETAALPALSTGFGALSSDAACFAKGPLLRHAISLDGSRAVWSYAGSYEGASSALFDRIDGAETIQLDAVQGGTAPHGGEGAYWDASLDGSKVFFTDPNKLTPGSTAAPGNPDLYRYDFDAPEGEQLTDLTAPNPIEAENHQADVQGVIGASAEGTYAYFAAAGVLSGEEENAAGEKALAGQNNLYAWHQGEGIRFIARLAGGDGSNWSADLSKQSARVTPDGRHLALLSLKGLTGYDNTDQTTGNADPEAFLYDYEAQSLVCASCNPSGSRPLGPSSLLPWSAPYQQPRYLSDDGDRLFFETRDALDPHDTNAKSDVYEFERPGEGSCEAGEPTFYPAKGGCLYLVSSGTDSDGSYLIDASADGRDVFIATRERLFGADRDERFDVYDARIGGGFPFNPPVECEGGEECREAASGPGQPSAPGTSAFQAPPEPRQGRCRKGFHSRHGRCVKSPRKPRPRHQHHRNRRADR